jgi:hypothetical protein
LSDPIEGKTQQPQLALVEMIDDNAGDVGDPQFLGDLPEPMPFDDREIAVDQDRPALPNRFMLSRIRALWVGSRRLTGREAGLRRSVGTRTRFSCGARSLRSRAGACAAFSVSALWRSRLARDLAETTPFTPLGGAIARFFDS